MFRSLICPLLVVFFLLPATPLPAQDGESWRQSIPWLRRDERRKPEFPPIAVSPAVAAERLAAGAIAVDTRSGDEPGGGYLPAAIRLELDDACIAEGVECLRRQLGQQGLGGEEELILYGDPLAVGRLFWLLEWAGLTEIEVLDGGTAAGRRDGRALSAQAIELAPTELALSAAEEVTVDSAWVAENFGMDGIAVVDLRSSSVWGASGGTLARTPGHLPHSLPFDFAALLPPDGSWPDPAAARRELGRLGPRPGTYVNLDSTFLLYGDGPRDPRLGLGYLLLRILDVRVRVYPGGWQEWSSQVTNPVVRVVDVGQVRDLLAADNPGFEEDRDNPQMLVLDTRGVLDYRAGHLPGAVSLPSHLCAEQLSEALPLPPGRAAANFPLLFYCYGSDCIRSRHCSTLAAQAGFTNLLWFREGVPAWLEAGLPLFVSDQQP